MFHKEVPGAVVAVNTGLIALNVFSIFLAWRQHQILDSARSELEEIVRGPVK